MGLGKKVGKSNDTILYLKNLIYSLITFICFFFRDIVIGGEIESSTFKAYLTYLYTNEIAFLDSDFENIFGNVFQWLFV